MEKLAHINLQSTGIIKIDKPASIPLERFDLRRWTGGLAIVPCLSIYRISREFSPDVDDGWHRDDLLYDVASFFCHIGNPMYGSRILSLSLLGTAIIWPIQGIL